MTVFKKLNTKTKGKESVFVKVTWALNIWKAGGSSPGWLILQLLSDQPVGAHTRMECIKSGILWCGAFYLDGELFKARRITLEGTDKKGMNSGKERSEAQNVGVQTVPPE